MSDGIPGDFVETAELQAVNCSALLERSAVLNAIDSEPEYEDAKYFRLLRRICG